ncbi:hypothetical protein BHE74_00016469 [Ensete ventricosum]|nr:hypothetical protein GW17_00034995 [Ensete ventricosum]RWW75509.1 hypothetical protein BHE74_00016469 [Ensete ventricosum]RZR91485.1 hypothetical protein BHM03_00019619 [Ensete ventricosum]
MPGILNIHVYVQTNIIFFQVIKFASPSSAGAESIDPDCSWVEQWYCLVIFFYELVHRAGPRKQIYYEPREVKAAIVTCGGLCPGLNDVIRQVEDILLSFLWLQIVLTLEKYGVKNIVGIPYGFRGFSDEGLSEVPVRTFPPIPISEDFTGDLYTHVSLNSTNVLLLCSFRVKTVVLICDFWTTQAKRIDMLFVLGGDGTHAGALAIHNEVLHNSISVN